MLSVLPLVREGDGDVEPELGSAGKPEIGNAHEVLAQEEAKLKNDKEEIAKMMAGGGGGDKKEGAPCHLIEKMVMAFRSHLRVTYNASNRA